MKKLYYCIFLFTVSIISFGQENLSGVFVTKFPYYGMFSETLTLNCDSTTILNFKGDLMNDNSNGKWSLKNKKLTLIFDSIQYPTQRYKGSIVYKIKRNRLYQIYITIEEYKELKLKAKNSHIENYQKVMMPTYFAFRRKYFKSMRNFHGKTGRQYFIKIKEFNCDNNKNR